MASRNKIIVKSAFLMAAAVASSALAEQGPSNVKSMRERYEQMIKENKEKTDQERLRKDGKLNRTMAAKPSSGLSEAERKMIAEGRRRTEEESSKPAASAVPKAPAPAISDSEKPQEGQVLIAGEHMKKLYSDLKRLPTHKELVDNLVKEMKIEASQAEKILAAMDID